MTRNLGYASIFGMIATFPTTQIGRENRLRVLVRAIVRAIVRVKLRVKVRELSH